MKCADCGANLNYKFTKDNLDNRYFSCKNNRAIKDFCKRSYYIRFDIIIQLVQNDIKDIEQFATEFFKDEFVKRVAAENYKRIQADSK